MGKSVLVVSFISSVQNGVGLLAEQMREDEDVHFEFFSKSLKSIVGDFFRIIRKGARCDTIVINYVFLCLLFAPIFRLLGKNVVFVPHEGEPLFPNRLKSEIHIIRRIIASKRLTSVCVHLANKTLCLSKLQAKALGTCDKDIIHFGTRFPLISSNEDSNLFFFPNRKHEEIKGYGLIKSCHHLMINHDEGELSYDKMVEFYTQAKVVLIPSMIETYSYCMAEAMLANCIVIVTKDVGLAYDLEERIGGGELESYGIYIVDKPEDVAKLALKHYELLITRPSRTRELALEHGLDGVSAIKKLEAFKDDKK
ncbi:glycosyltransferase family protein [Pseudoalteromonas aurantia]|uniref:Glycosyl transferase family 1 domain-containing protein n=1 Tax=Pseudoalteromonas aurantia 208 TaxID=1314867 RepID=A0ABR9EES6_9GAMM|nr:hypothetical protein [Pseudoalteromonas aurantia]MBE0369272.1 hypothetical protein [Pseudoalteromonas aurantia 208]